MMGDLSCPQQLLRHHIFELYPFHFLHSPKRYTLNYHKLKEGGAFKGGKGAATILADNELPATVTGNVKNVQGWRSGAERGFLGSYTGRFKYYSFPCSETTYNILILLSFGSVIFYLPCFLFYRHYSSDMFKYTISGAV